MTHTTDMTGAPGAAGNSAPRHLDGQRGVAPPVDARVLSPSMLGETFEGLESLDAASRPLADASRKLIPPGPVADLLHGTWLGHPLHPMLTDVAIGAWTGSFFLDLVGGRRSRPASRRLVAIGVATAVPTALSGLADWRDLGRAEQRVGVVHALSNSGGLALYLLSYRARRRGHHARGVAWGMMATGALTLGGLLGGHLSFRRMAGVNHAIDSEGPVDWTAVADEARLGPEPTVVDAGGAPVPLARDGGRLVAIGATCSHQGGPLGEGTFADGCVTCPWHGSTFRLSDGRVERGPASVPQPCYGVRTVDGRVEVRREHPPAANAAGF